MKKKGTERHIYPKEFKAEAAALAEKREKPISKGLAMTFKVPIFPVKKLSWKSKS